MEIQEACIEACIAEAKASLAAGGVPVGSVLAKYDEIIARGHNRRVQDNAPILHGEMDAINKAGRRSDYPALTLYTSLSPCMMCAGAIVQFKIPRVVILDATNFGGNEDFLRARGVAVHIIANAQMTAIMGDFIRDQPRLWNEDIAE